MWISQTGSSLSLSLASTWVVLLLLASAGASTAYVGDEHQWFSRRGLCVALAHTERASAEPSARQQRAIEVLEALQEGNGQLPDYGRMVAYGDYVTFPNEMLDTSKSDSERIASLHVLGRSESVFAEYTEMLRNPHHFRVLGLSQFHIWHHYAVSLASQIDSEAGPQGPLFDALAFNAYADHFLEDFFAPGHMVREDSGLSHMGTLRVHDTENWTGRLFQPSEGTSEILASVLGDTAAERDESIRRCFDPVEELTPDDLERALTSDSIHMKGDNQVYREDDGIREGREQQALFVVLVVARSILDVVESYIHSDAYNTFPNRKCPDMEVVGATAEVEGSPEPNQGGCYFVRNEDETSDSFAAISLGYYRSEPEAARFALIWPTLGASVELQKIDGSARWQTSLEALYDLPFERAMRSVGIGGDWTQYFSAELATGYSYINKGGLEPGGGGNYNGHGPDVRLYLRAKQLYMFASVGVGWRFYHGLGQSSNNVRVEGRLGFGNGIFWAYASVSRDERLSVVGIRDDYQVFSFGVNMTIPSTRALGWVGGY